RSCRAVSSSPARCRCSSSTWQPWRSSSKCCHAENSRATTRKPAMPTDFHSSRCFSSSTSRTIGLLRTSFRIAYSDGFITGFFARARAFPSRHPFRGAELGAARARIAVDFRVGRDERLLGQHLYQPVALLQRPQRVLDDAVLEGVEGDHHQPRAGAEATCRQFHESI